MKAIRPVLAAAAVAVAAITALPAHAAASRTLYFDNQGSTSQTGCTPTYVLTKSKATGSPCGHITVGYMGVGTSVSKIPPSGAAFASDTYDALASATKFKLDAKRAITGTVYLAVVPLIGLTAGPAATPDQTGGPAGATVTVVVNGTKVGSASGSNIAAPNSTVAVPVSLKVPASLNGKVVKSISVQINYTGGAGVTTLSYTGASASNLIFPTR
jgi:hypothetical protein